MVGFLSARYREAATDASAVNDYVSQETLGRTIVFAGTPQTSYTASPSYDATSPKSLLLTVFHPAILSVQSLV
jgi:hypothetical protein